MSAGKNGSFLEGNPDGEIFVRMDPILNQLRQANQVLVAISIVFPSKRNWTTNWTNAHFLRLQTSMQMLHVLEALEKRFDNLERSFDDRLAILAKGLDRCCSESARCSDELQARSERLALHDKLCFLQTSVDGLSSQSTSDATRNARTAGRASLRLSIFLVHRNLARQCHHLLLDAFSSWGGRCLQPGRPAPNPGRPVKPARPGNPSGRPPLHSNGNGPPGPPQARLEARCGSAPKPCVDATAAGGPDGAPDPLIAIDPANAPPLAPEPVPPRPPAHRDWAASATGRASASARDAGGNARGRLIVNALTGRAPGGEGWRCIGGSGTALSDCDRLELGLRGWTRDGCAVLGLCGHARERVAIECERVRACAYGGLRARV
jgi:hypothetical protein